MVQLAMKPIPWERVVYLDRSAAARGSGAVDTFVGLVRADWHGRRQVQALFYEAYVEMAQRHITRLIDEARARWPVDAVHVQHRLGLVEAGQISVVIAVAAQHRAEAYEASRFVMERIKHDVPIWKREHYDDGTAQWTMCRQELLTVADPRGGMHAHL